jgi:hypothetical protein
MRSAVEPPVARRRRSAFHVAELDTGDPTTSEGGAWKLGFAPRSDGLSQEEILQDEFPLSPQERGAANAARYFAVICFRPSFNSHDLIESLAVRARK